MAINKKLIHFNTFENFNSKKLSANKENTQYTLGINGSIITGDPEVLYQSIVYIKDTQLQWTHGLLYNGENLRSDLDLILDGTSVVAKALNDANGNNIIDTYATKSELNSRVFIGTRSEYDSAYANNNIAAGALVIILDGSESNSDTISLLGTAILGKMILGNF